MSAFTNKQRTGILERLKHNHKYAVVIFYANASFPEKEALDFASVLDEGGWTVLGPFPSDSNTLEGIRIGVRDPRSPGPSAHLLLDVLVSVSINVSLATAPGGLPATPFEGCCLLLSPPRAD